MGKKQKPNCHFLLILLVLIAGCQSRPEIQNVELDHYRYGKFVILHKPLYGFGYHQSDLDELQYLKPEEIEKKHYTFILGHEHVHEPLRRLEEAKNCMKPSFPISMASF